MLSVPPEVSDSNAQTIPGLESITVVSSGDDFVALQTAAANNIETIYKRTYVDAARQVAQGAWEIGRELLTLKTAIPHGDFRAFLRDQIQPATGLSSSTLGQWMQAAKYPDFRKFVGDKTALSILTKKKNPDEARSEALALFGAGTYVTYKRAKELILPYAVEEARMNSAGDNAAGETNADAAVESSAQDATDTEEADTEDEAGEGEEHNPDAGSKSGDEADDTTGVGDETDDGAGGGQPEEAGGDDADQGTEASEERDTTERADDDVGTEHGTGDGADVGDPQEASDHPGSESVDEKAEKGRRWRDMSLRPALPVRDPELVIIATPDWGFPSTMGEQMWKTSSKGFPRTSWLTTRSVSYQHPRPGLTLASRLWRHGDSNIKRVSTPSRRKRRSCRRRILE